MIVEAVSVGVLLLYTTPLSGETPLSSNIWCVLIPLLAIFVGLPKNVLCKI